MSTVRKVSILIPTYNGAAFLKRCLQSVLEQTYGDWRVIVADDASGDASVEVVRSVHVPELTLQRRDVNLGWGANVNRMIAEVDSPYIAVLHQDDWWEPEFLMKMAALLDRQPNSLMATSAVRRQSEKGQTETTGLHRFWAAEMGSTCPSPVAVRALTLGCCIFTPGVLARSELYRRVGGYDESLPQTADWLMWLRAATASSVEVCAEVLATYREHKSSLTARIARANARGSDLVRMVQTIQSEWRDSEPFAGASQQLAATAVVELLAYGATRLEVGDAEGATRQAALARTIAPSLALKALAWGGQLGFNLTHKAPIRGIQRHLLRAGRLIWHASPW